MQIIKSITGGADKGSAKEVFSALYETVAKSLPEGVDAKAVEQAFKKAGVILDGDKLKVYVYDWDGKACHHVGYVEAASVEDAIKYFNDKFIK